MQRWAAKDDARVFEGRTLQSLQDVDRSPDFAALRETTDYKGLRYIRSDEKLLKIHLEMLQYLCYAALVTPPTGHVGAAAHSVLVDDVLAVFLGHPLPLMVLR